MYQSDCNSELPKKFAENRKNTKAIDKHQGYYSPWYQKCVEKSTPFKLHDYVATCIVATCKTQTQACGIRLKNHPHKIAFVQQYDEQRQK